MTNATNKASNKETIKSASTKAAAEVIQTAAAPTKADKARLVFDECYGMKEVPQRKDIIARAMAEANLSKPAAATYLQNYKDKKGLSVKKAKATA